MAERHEDPSQQLTAQRYAADQLSLANDRAARARRDAELSALVESQRADQEADDPTRVYSLAEARHIVAPSPDAY